MSSGCHRSAKANERPASRVGWSVLQTQGGGGGGVESTSEAIPSWKRKWDLRNFLYPAKQEDSSDWTTVKIYVKKGGGPKGD